MPKEFELNVLTYVKLVIGAVYRFQHKLATKNEAEAISFTRLLM